MTADKRECIITVDMDNFSDYARIYSIPEEGIDNDIMYTKVIPRFLDIFLRHNVKATFFVVGRDCESPCIQSAVREMSARGHEIASHTYSHRFIRPLSRAEKKTEIAQAHKILSYLRGRPIAGFRAPNSFVDKEILRILEEAGYLYDSSLYPALTYPIERVILYLTTKRKIKEFLPGIEDIKSSFASDRIHKIKETSLFEVPTTVVPFFKLPFLATMAMAFKNDFYFDWCWHLIKRFVDTPVFHLHGMDLFSAQDDACFKTNRENAFDVHPGAKQPLALKVKKLERILTAMGKDFRFVTAEEFVLRGRNRIR